LLDGISYFRLLSVADDTGMTYGKSNQVFSLRKRCEGVSDLVQIMQWLVQKVLFLLREVFLQPRQEDSQRCDCGQGEKRFEETLVEVVVRVARHIRLVLYRAGRSSF
jgi:hypothetical protein